MYAITDSPALPFAKCVQQHVPRPLRDVLLPQATSLPVKAIWAIPEAVPNDLGADKLAELSKLLDMTQKDLRAKLSMDKTFVYVKRQVPLEVGELGRREPAFEIVVHQLDHLLAGELSGDVDHALQGLPRFKRSIKWSPTRSALAMTVKPGFTAPEEGKKLASTT